jgi:hypothetical protein
LTCVHLENELWSASLQEIYVAAMLLRMKCEVARWGNCQRTIVIVCVYCDSSDSLGDYAKRVSLI